MELFTDIILLFIIAIPVLYLCNRLKIPSIVGLLAIGVAAGPRSMGLLSDTSEVEILSEIGIILLLFTIGLEFSLQKLLTIRKSVLLGGALQVFATTGAVFSIALLFGAAPETALFYGFVVSLSSTAIVLKLLQENAAIDSPSGRTSLAILIFQDIIVVPFMLIVPLLAGATSAGGGSALMLAFKSAVIIALTYTGSKWIVPALMLLITRTRSRELFLISIFAVCFGVAWTTYLMGLSLSLGAFLAGLIISGTEYSHEAIGNIVPFRDIFTSIFFMSIGMLLDVRFLWDHLPVILALTLAVLAGKTLIVSLSALPLGLPAAVCVMTGLVLSQIGEFSFILLKAGRAAGLADDSTYQAALAAIILTMVASPFLINFSINAAGIARRLPFPEFIKKRLYRALGNAEEDDKNATTDHLVIVGFGVNGRNVARSAKLAGIPYRIIEMNPDTVRNERNAGEPILYGDASHEEILDYAGIRRARIIVLTIPDPAAVKRTTVVSKRLNPDVYVIARTRFIQEVTPLYRLGADEVIPEEYETSIEIFTRVLKKYLVPENDIERFTEDVRSDGYMMFRKPSAGGSLSISDVVSRFRELDFATYRVERGSPADGKTLAELDMRRRYGASAAAIYRGKREIYNPDGREKIQEGDILLLLGNPRAIGGTIAVLKK